MRSGADKGSEVEGRGGSDNGSEAEVGRGRVRKGRLVERLAYS